MMNLAIHFPIARLNRLPAWALGLSLAVHFAVLAGPFLQRKAAEVELPPLVVSLRMPAVPPPATAETAPQPTRLVPPEPVAVTRPKTRAQLPVAASTVMAVAGAESATRSTLTDAVIAPASERSEAVPPARASEASPVVASADPAAMVRYIRMLGDLLAQQQQYPRLAAVRGWEGEVRLRLQVARKGTIISVHIVRSSGFDVLDQHAVQLVQSTTLPPPPAVNPQDAATAGAGPDFQIDIPIHYSLKRST